MRALALRLAGGDEGTADDLVQETLLAAVRRPPRDRGALGGWLRTVLRNFAGRFRIEKERRRRREEAAARPEREASSPDRLAERAELHRDLVDCVLRLREPLRSTVLLRFFEELPPGEIARLQGVPVTTVRSRLVVALEELRRAFARRHGGDAASRRATLLALAGVTWAGFPGGPATAAEVSTSLEAFARSGGAETCARTAIETLSLGALTMTSKKIGIAVAASLALLLGTGLVTVLIVRHAHYADPRLAGARPADRDEPPDAVAFRENGSIVPLATPLREPGPETAVDSASIAGPAIHGRVLDLDGAAIPGARVRAVRAGDRSQEEELAHLRARGSQPTSHDFVESLRRFRERLDAGAADLPSAESGEDGAYRVGVPGPGEYRVLADDSRFVAAAAGPVEVTPDGDAELEIRLERGHALRGRVVGAGGEPVAGAIVRASPSARRALSPEDRYDALVSSWERGLLPAVEPETTSAPDGTFRLGGLACEPHDLLAWRSGYRSGRLHDLAPVADAGSPADDPPAGGARALVVLEPGLAVSGRVVGPDGAPIAGATVRMEPVARSAARPYAVGEALHPHVPAGLESLLVKPDPPPVTTGAEGRFVIDQLDQGAYRLEAAASGHPPLVREIELSAHPLDLGVLELAIARRIGGVVLDPDGAPVADALVWIEAPVRRGIPAWGGRFFAAGAAVETRSDHAGRFVLEGLADGAVHGVRAMSARHLGGIAPAVAAGREDVSVRLGRGKSVEGVVTDKLSGEPVAGAILAATDGIQGVDLPEKTVVSGADGGFVLSGLPDRFGLRARHDDYPGIWESREVETTELKVELFAGDRLEGRVVDESGASIAGALVRVHFGGISEAWLGRVAGGQRSPVRAGGDGRFALVLPAIARERYVRIELAAEHARGVGSMSLDEKPAPAEPWPEVLIVLSSPVTLDGRVVDGDGRGVGGARVTAWRLGAGEGAGSRSRSTLSGPDGRWRLAGLEPGRHAVEARAMARVPARRESVEVPAGASLDLVLGEGWSLDGGVVDDSGAGVPGALVLAFRARELDGRDDYGTESQRRERRQTEGGVVSALTDVGGRYRLEHLPGERLTLVARAEGHEASALHILEPGAAQVDFTLQRLGALAGVVTDAESARPLSTFTVALHAEAGDGGGDDRRFLPREFEDPHGEFFVDGLKPGRYAVIVRVAGRPLAGSWVELVPGGSAELRFAIERGRVVRGVVRDADSGEPIPSVTVALSNRDRDAWESKWPLENPHGKSGADGSFAIEGLQAGRYAVWANHPQYRVADERIRAVVPEAAAGEPEPLEIRMRRGGTVEGELVNVSKRGKRFMQMIRVRPKGGSGEGFWGYIDRERETFRAPSVPPGAYEVYLREQILAPGVDKEATSFRREDMIEEDLYLGDVEVRVGETTTFNARLDALD
jgi:RNA polymerase sigma factor (sigma-70 family)